jgi:hypothetical protein
MEDTQRKKGEATAARLGKEWQKVQHQTRLAKAAARKTQHAGESLQAGLSSKRTKKTNVLLAKMPPVERAAASAKKRQVLISKTLRKSAACKPRAS